jgi:hypothetical protein
MTKSGKIGLSQPTKFEGEPLDLQLAIFPLNKSMLQRTFGHHLDVI